MKTNRPVKAFSFAPAVDAGWESRLVTHVHRRGIEDLGVFLLQRLRRPFQIEYGGRATFRERRSVGVSVSARIHLEPFGAVTIELDQSLAACVVDLMVGGNGERDAEPFTELESTLLRRFATDLCPVIGRWWREARPQSLRVDAIRVASVPSFDAAIGGEGFTFRLSRGPVGGTLTAWYDSDCLRLLARRGLRGSGLDSDGLQELEPGEAQALAHQLDLVRLTVSVLLGRLNLSMRELLELDAGDVLITHTGVGANVPVLVEGRPKFSGALGRRGGQLAVEVLEDIEEESEQHA